VGALSKSMGKALVPSYAYMRLFACDGSLTISATDGQITGEADVPLDGEVSDGEVLVPSERFRGIVRRMEGEKLSCRLESGEFSFSDESSSFTLPTLDGAEFPDMPPLSEELPCGDIGVLVESMARATKALRYYEGQPAGTAGVCLEWHDGKIHCVGLCSVRGLWFRQSMEDDTKHVVVVTDKLARSLRAFSALGTFGRIVVGKSAIGFVGDNIECAGRLLEAEYPDYEGIIPKSHLYGGEVEASAMTKALARLSMVGDADSSVTISFEPESVILYTSAKAGGTAREVIAGENVSHPDFTYSCILSHLGVVLKNCGAEKVRIEVGGDMDPMLIKDVEDGDRLTGLVMPARPD